MRPLLYILRKTLKNHLKEMKKKPAVLIAYSIVALLMVFAIIATFLMPTGMSRRGSVDTFGALVAMALLTFLYFGIKQGISNGSSFFRMADVNLTFTAPISPKRILVYGFIQQLMVTLFLILLLSFQIPNLKNNFPIKGWGIATIFVCVFFLLFAMQLIGILVYSLASKSQKTRNLMEKGLNALVILFAAGFVLCLIQVKDPIKAAVNFLNNSYMDYIPFIGWFKVVMTSAVSGISTRFYFNLVLIVLVFTAMIMAVYKLKIDYFEDVLAATEHKEQLIAAKRAGKNPMHLRNTKLKKVTQKYGGTGGMAIYYRHMLEYKKSGMFFINKTTFVMVAIGIASKYFFANTSHHSFDFRLILYATIYILFFFSIQGKWVQELSKPFIYLIPASSASKVFFGTLAETLKNLVDGLILFAVAGFMLKASIQVILLSAVTYTTYGIIYIYGDILSRRLFGGTHSKNLEVFVKMFLILFIIAPGIVISIITSTVLANNMIGNYIFYSILIAYNLLAASLILLACKGIFEVYELK